MMKKDEEENRSKMSDKSANSGSPQFDFTKYQSFIEEVVSELFINLEYYLLIYIIEIKKLQFT